MKTKLIHFIVLSGLTLCAPASAAQIRVVNTGSLNATANQISYTLSFDAGNGGSVDKVIVSAGVESAVTITGPAPEATLGNIGLAASVSLNVPVNDSFVFAAHTSNNDIAPAATADVPLTEIFSVNGDSATMAAGYENFVR